MMKYLKELVEIGWYFDVNKDRSIWGIPSTTLVFDDISIATPVQVYPQTNYEELRERFRREYENGYFFGGTFPTHAFHFGPGENHKESKSDVPVAFLRFNDKDFDRICKYFNWRPRKI